MENTVQKSRAVYILLGLFLGGLGIHDFYAGRIREGVTTLIVSIVGIFLQIAFIGVGIYVLYEIITVKKDGKGNPMK